MYQVSAKSERVTWGTYKKCAKLAWNDPSMIFSITYIFMKMSVYILRKIKMSLYLFPSYPGQYQAWIYTKKNYKKIKGYTVNLFRKNL